MAKRNFTVQEMVEILDKGEDFEAISYMGRCYPLPMFAIMKALRNGDGLIEFSKVFPEYLTATKLQRQMKAELLGDVDVDGDDEDEEEAEEEAKPKRKAPAKKAPAKKAAAKKPAKKAEPEDDDDDEDDAGEGSEYEGKPATELYKLCKKRGIKAAPRKSAKFYIDLLEQDDAKAADAEAEDDDEDDDWDI